MTGTINFSSAGSNLQSLGTSNGSYLFKYLPNITGIILDGCTALTNSYNLEGTSIFQMDFTYMLCLQNLSIQNCSSLTSDIDLTSCTDIRQIDASGTTINVLIPEGAKLTKYELGTPTSISIINPTVLTVGGTKVDNSYNLASLDLKNIPNNHIYFIWNYRGIYVISNKNIKEIIHPLTLLYQY